MAEPQTNPKTAGGARSGFRRIFADVPQEPNLLKRAFWGAAFGTIGYVALVVLSGPSWQFSFFTVALIALGVAASGAFVVLVARMRPDYWLIKMAGAALFGLVIGYGRLDFLTMQPVPFLGDALEKSEVEAVAGIYRALDRPKTAVRIERIPLVNSISSGATVAMALALVVAAIRTPARAIKRRVLLYLGGLVALIVVYVAIVAVFLYDALQFALTLHSFGTIAFLGILLWGFALDMGQLFGGSRPIEQHNTAAVALLGALLAAIAGMFWRPLVAEYYFTRYCTLRGDGGLDTLERQEARRAFLEKAYRVCPSSEKMTYHYAEYVLVHEATFSGSRKDYDAAIKNYLEAMRVFPREPRHWSMLGLTYSRKGEHKLALQCCREGNRLTEDATFTRAKNHYARKGVWLSGADKTTLITCLANEGSTESIAEIITYLRVKKVGHVEVYAAKILAGLGEKEAIGPIKELLANGEIVVTPPDSTRRELRDALDKLEHGAAR